MYKDFFHFSAEPFRVTPDPGFLYLTDQHKEALAAIIYGIAKRKGFVCITGEVGVGKTTILRSYLDSVDEPGLRFVYIYNPNVSFAALLRHIFKEIDLSYPGEDLAGMVEALHGWLQERHKRRETLVLLIDEAQNMPLGTLENLRLLSNIETATEKLVQVVLVGQPELETLLAQRQLRQLESRIAVRTRLGPLSRAESAAYVRHRLKCVALDDKPAFTDGAINLLVRQAKGIPRRINVLADNALMTACGLKARPVTARIMREVIRDLRLKDGEKPGMADWLGRMPWRWAAWAGGGAAALALAVWGVMSLPQPPTTRHATVITGVALPPSSALQPGGQAAAPAEPPLSEPSLADASGPEPFPSEPAPVLAQPAAVAASEAAVPDLAAVAPPAAPPENPAAMSEGRKRTLRIVAPGDTLTGLTFQVYGKVDRGHLDWVKRHNPGLTDIDRLQVGQVIEFPLTPSGGLD